VRPQGESDISSYLPILSRKWFKKNLFKKFYFIKISLIQSSAMCENDDIVSW